MRTFLVGIVLSCFFAAPLTAGAAANESQIQADLQSFVQSYVSNANKRMSVSRIKPQVIKRGSGYVAMYTEIDPRSAYAQMKKSNSKHFDYVATLRYEEKTYECQGATRKAASTGEFRCVKVRRLTELPRYVKGKWEN